jgi:hypothetical protein
MRIKRRPRDERSSNDDFYIFDMTTLEAKILFQLLQELRVQEEMPDRLTSAFLRT